VIPLSPIGRFSIIETLLPGAAAAAPNALIAQAFTTSL
jgi:hypothetical protein